MSKLLKYNGFLKINESLDSNLINKIDYTLLKPDATKDQIIELCDKAEDLGVKSVCVLPKMVKVAAEALQNSNVLVCTVISFPHGTDSTSQKLAETKQVIADGADEVDMVLNYPKLQELIDSIPDTITDEWETDYHFELEDLIVDVETLVDECHGHTNKDNEPIILKVIVESGLLNDVATEEATNICLEAGADFIKTSTGMKSVGAELNKVQIMRKIINREGSDMKIKASGGLRTMVDLQKFEPYVDRFGVGFSAVDSIFSGQKNLNSGGY